MRPPAATRSIVCSMAARRAGRFHDDRHAFAVGDFEHAFQQPVAAGDRRGAEVGGGGEPLGGEIGGVDLGAVRARDLDDRQPDRPGAEHQHGVVGGDHAAPAALHADRHRLGERRLEVGEGIGHDVEIADRRRDEIGEAAFAMDADDGEVGAAIALADPAGIAVAAADERVDDHARADRPGRWLPGP